jgi:hypothetical protein
MEEIKPKGNTPEYRAWYWKNKYSEKGKISKKEKDLRNREYIIDYKQKNECVKCGEKRYYVLDFHHLDPTLKYKSVTDLQFNAYSIKTIDKEIEKCILLCRNCHSEFHHLERQNPLTTQEYLNLK